MGRLVRVLAIVAIVGIGAVWAVYSVLYGENASVVGLVRTISHHVRPPIECFGGSTWATATQQRDDHLDAELKRLGNNGRAGPDDLRTLATEFYTAAAEQGNAVPPPAGVELNRVTARFYTSMADAIEAQANQSVPRLSDAEQKALTDEVVQLRQRYTEACG